MSCRGVTVAVTQPTSLRYPTLLQHDCCLFTSPTMFSSPTSSPQSKPLPQSYATQRTTPSNSFYISLHYADTPDETRPRQSSPATPTSHHANDE